MEPGVYAGLSSDAYHNGPGVNKGLLDTVRRSPMHAKASMDRSNDNDAPESVTFFIGREVHALVLEPEEFARDYITAFEQDDMPDAIHDRDTLLALVDNLNLSRLAKLPTSGGKADLIARIEVGAAEQGAVVSEALASMSGAELKAEIENLNRTRQGKLPLTGSMRDLADTLRLHGVEVTLWADVKEQWERANTGRRILTKAQWELTHAMRDAVMAHPMARALLTGEGLAEMSIYWIDARTGELCRCRPDRWRADGILIDLKTTEDASPEAFASSVHKWRYHVQDPWYLEGAQTAHAAGHAPDGWERPKAFVFIAVEKKAPHAVGVYMLDEESRAEGITDMRADLAKLTECKRTGVWPGYGDTLQRIGLPEWVMRKRAFAGAA